MKPPSTLRLFLPACRVAAQAPSSNPQRLPRQFLLALIFIPAALCLSTGFCSATVVYQVGAESFWTSGGGSNISWTALGGNDVAGDYTASSSQFDFVGNSTNPGLYYARTADYVFFRMRVDADPFPTTANTSPSGAYFVMIDIVGSGIEGIDYALAWDSFNGSRNFDANHGLEMLVRDPEHGGLLTSTWDTTSLNDIDGNSGQKGPNDINGTAVGEGFVRTTDNVAAGTAPDFGTTTFIDFAVQWSYLTADTTLTSTQTWNVTLANLYHATTGNDHQIINGDVLGCNLGDPLSSASWSTVPEPSSALAGLLLGAGLLRRRRKLAPL